MLDAGVIGVVVGLILVYFVLSLLCSGINELMEAFLRRRAKFLEGGVVDLLGPALKEQLYDHPLLEALYPQKGRPTTEDAVPHEDRRKPSYIPPETFSQAVLSILTDGSARLIEAVDANTDTLSVDSTTGIRQGFTIQAQSERMQVAEVRDKALRVSRGHDRTVAAPHERGVRVTRYRGEIPEPADLLAEVQESVDSLPSGRLREALGGLMTTAGPDLARWRQGLEAWFDAKMDRVSGWYSRQTRWLLFAFGVVIVIGLNADTALFARTLWGDATLRDSIVAQAEIVADAGGTQEPCQDPACVAERLQDVKALGLPLGWPDLRVAEWDEPSYADEERVPHNAAEAVVKLFGILLTAAALTLGAPFWFDLLNKLSNFRVSGPPPERSSPTERTAT